MGSLENAEPDKRHYDRKAEQGYESKNIGHEGHRDINFNCWKNYTESEHVFSS